MAIGPEIFDHGNLTARLGTAELLIDNLIGARQSPNQSVSVRYKDMHLNLLEFTNHLWPKYREAGWKSCDEYCEYDEDGNNPIVIGVRMCPRV